MSNKEKSQLPIGPTKTEMFRQCNMAGVDTKELKRTKSNFVQCNESIDALNRILFCQQMVKCNGQLSSAMIENLPTYNKMKIKLASGQQDKNFQVINKILYKKVSIFNQDSFKLCLPSFVANDILNIEHLRNNSHLSIKPLTDRFSYLFYVPNLHEKASKVIKSCLTCMLAATSYKQKISGSKRTYESNRQEGEVYIGDIAYLPASTRGYRFCLVLVERLTSFVSAIPLKTLNAESTSNAIRLFVSIVGFSMSKFCSDYGPEFATKFTRPIKLNGHRTCL